MATLLPKTERQADVLNYIRDYSVRRGHQPSYTMIARFLGVGSRATVAKHIESLERQGLLKRVKRGGVFALEFETENARCPKCNHEFFFRSSGEGIS